MNYLSYTFLIGATALVTYIIVARYLTRNWFEFPGADQIKWK